MKLLALIYSAVTLASLTIGTHAYDHQDDSAHLRGAIEAIKFLTEDNDTCSEIGDNCEVVNNLDPCCRGSRCVVGGTCQCGLDGDMCSPTPTTCCPGFICSLYRCTPAPPPPTCLEEGDDCYRSEFSCCKGLVCDRRFGYTCTRDNRQAEILFAEDTNTD